MPVEYDRYFAKGENVEAYVRPTRNGFPQPFQLRAGIEVSRAVNSPVLWRTGAGMTEMYLQRFSLVGPPPIDPF